MIVQEHTERRENFKAGSAAQDSYIQPGVNLQYLKLFLDVFCCLVLEANVSLIYVRIGTAAKVR
jgi:hypothetical protein